MALRILHAAEHYAPSVGGAQAVVRQVSERLVADGHDVTVATSIHPDRHWEALAGVRVREFQVTGNAVRGMKGEVDAYQRFVLEGDFDVMMSYAAQQWTTDALLDHVGGIRARSVLAPCGFSGLYDPAYREYFARLPDQLRAFDHVILHSDHYRDARFVREAGIAATTLIPNAADEREFEQPQARGSFRRAHGIGEDAPLLLTVGGHTGLKGHAQAMAVLRAARSARGGTLAVLGNEPHGPGCLRLCRARAAYTRAVGRGRRVLLADPPREQVVAAYTDADLFVFCSMVECSPLVLFEAMAAGLPFVSVDVGNAAEIAEWSGAGVIVPARHRDDGLIEADAAAVAEAVDALMEDPARRAEMAERGRRAWRERFTWARVAERYGEVYERVAAA